EHYRERRSTKSPHHAAFLGTFAPFLRASESPMAMSCLRLFTVPPFPPLPDLSVSLFLRRIALATVLPAALPYLLPPGFFRCAIFLSRISDANRAGRAGSGYY